MTKVNIIIGGVIGLIVLVSGVWCYLVTYKPTVTNFEECVKAGYLVMESYPAKCQTPTGEQFIQEATVSDNLIINNLSKDTPIIDGFKIIGQAKGNWFFEGSFPIVLQDENGKVIVTTIAQATKDWMSPDFVPFEATLNFNVISDINGTLIFKKDNPSGLPEHDAQLAIPVLIKK